MLNNERAINHPSTSHAVSIPNSLRHLFLARWLLALPRVGRSDALVLNGTDIAIRDLIQRCIEESGATTTCSQLATR